MKNTNSINHQHDKIDLFWWVSILKRNKWLILSFVVMATLVVMVFGLLYPKNISSAVIYLPWPDYNSRLWGQLKQYNIFANSGIVMRDVQYNSEYQGDLKSLRGKFRFDLQYKPRTLTVITTLSKDSVGLVEHWLDAYIRNIRLRTLHRLDVLRKSAKTNLALLQEQSLAIQSELDNYILTNDIKSQKTQRAVIQYDQTISKTRLYNLSQINIPSHEFRLESLVDTLDSAVLEEAGITTLSANIDIPEAIVVVNAMSQDISMQHQTIRSRILTLEQKQFNLAKQQYELESDIFEKQANLDLLISANLASHAIDQRIKDTRTVLDNSKKELDILNNNIASNSISINQLKNKQVKVQSKLGRVDELLNTLQEISHIKENLNNWRAEVKYLNNHIVLLEIQWEADEYSRAKTEFDLKQLMSKHNDIKQEIKSIKAEIKGLNEDITRAEIEELVIVLREPHILTTTANYISAAHLLLGATVGFVLGLIVAILLDSYRGIINARTLNRTEQ